MAKFKFFSVGGEADTDTNTNLANANLTADGDRQYNLASGDGLVFMTNSLTPILSINDTPELSIGGITAYKMPMARASATDKVLISTDGSGTMDFKTIYNFNSMSFIGRDTSLSNGNMIIFSNAGVLDAGNGTSLSFSSATRCTPIIPSSTTSAYYRAKAGLSITETGLSNISLFMAEVEPNNTTTFDFSTQTDLGDFTINGTTNTLSTTAFTTGSDTLMDEGKWYFFGLKNASGSTITNVAIWITITWYEAIYVK